MNSNAKALTFKAKTFDVVDQNGQPWLTMPDIAGVLYHKGGEQTDPSFVKGGGRSDPPSANAIRQVQQLYQRHSDEFSGQMTALVEKATAGGKQMVRIFSLRGAHLLAMFARTEVAKEFRAWVLDLLDREYAFTQGRDDVLTADQAERLRKAMQGYAAQLPLEKQGTFMTQGWSKMKSHFGVAYRQIPQRELTSALSIISRHAAQWELVDDVPALPAPSAAMSDLLKNNLQGLCLHMEYLASWWRTYGPAIRDLGPDAAAPVHDHFVDGVCFARNVARTAGVTVSDKIAGYPWRGDPHERRLYSMRHLHK